MALKYGNRVKVNAAAAPALGNFILGAPVSGYQSFASAISSLTTGDTVRYVIEDGSNWEIGTGTYNTTGPQIARTTVIQSSAGGTSLINATSNAIILLSVAAGDFFPSDGGTVTGPVVLGVTSFTSSITEAVFAITGTTPAINPTNGTIQTWTLTNNSTPTFIFSDGQSMTIMVDDGSAFSITWPTISWKTNNATAPALNTSGYTAIIVWRVAGVYYGARVGNS